MPLRRDALLLFAASGCSTSQAREWDRWPRSARPPKRLQRSPELFAHGALATLRADCHDRNAIILADKLTFVESRLRRQGTRGGHLFCLGQAAADRISLCGAITNYSQCFAGCLES